MRATALRKAAPLSRTHNSLHPQGLAARFSQGAEADHHQHQYDVLDDQKTDGDPTVEGIDFPFVGEQLDNDDGAGKGEGYCHVQRGHHRQTQAQGQKEADYRGKQDLAQSGGQGHPTHGFNQMKIQLEAHHEQQQGYAHMGQ